MKKEESKEERSGGIKIGGEGKREGFTVVKREKAELCADEDTKEK